MALCCGLDDVREQCRTGIAVCQRCTIEQQTRAERAKDEILKAGFGRARTVATQGRHHIKRKRLQLEAHVKRHQITGRDHDHHANYAKRDKHRVFKAQQAFALHIFLAHHQYGSRGKQNSNLCKARKRIVDEHSAKGCIRTFAAHADPKRQRKKHSRRRPNQHRTHFVLGCVDRT